MRTRQMLTHAPKDGPLWVRLYVHPIEEKWAGIVVADRESPPEPDSLKGLAFFADTAEEAERLAVAYLGEDVAQS